MTGNINQILRIVGKYTQFPDAYTSVSESLEHAAFKADTELNIDFIDSESLTLENIPRILSNIDGIIVPGGFGERGVEGRS